jgi:hypothetical protein
VEEYEDKWNILLGEKKTGKIISTFSFENSSWIVQEMEIEHPASLPKNVN